MTDTTQESISLLINTSTKERLFHWQIEMIKLSLEMKRCPVKCYPIKRMFRFNPDNPPVKIL